MDPGVTRPINLPTGSFQPSDSRQRERENSLISSSMKKEQPLLLYSSPRCSPLSMLVTSDTCSIRRSEVSSKEENRGNLANRRKERKKKEKSRLKQRAMESFERWWSNDDYYQIEQGKQCHRKRDATRVKNGVRVNDGRRGDPSHTARCAQAVRAHYCVHTAVRISSLLHPPLTGVNSITPVT